MLISDSSNNLVGGTAAGAGNVIANHLAGVEIFGLGNVVQGNFIGTNAAGTAALGNATGVQLSVNNLNSINNSIGGTATGAGNLISGNTGDGIRISSGTGNLIQGNRIGLAADGTTALANAGDGVEISGGNNNTVGGTAADAANTIAFNGGDGVFVSVSSGNSILRNSIHSNTGLGIDLGTNGATTNDNLDPDTGSNNLQNFPEISTATFSNATGMLTLPYVVPSSTANSAYPLRVEFFKADAAGQEGQTFLGFDTYLEGEANTSKTTAFTPSAAVAVGDKIVGTATDNNGNTSEFTILNATVQPAPCSLVVSTTSDADNAGDGVNSLREAILCSNSTSGKDTITFNIHTTGPATISPQSELPPIVDPVIIDGTSQPGSDCNSTISTLRVEIERQPGGSNRQWLDGHCRGHHHPRAGH